MNIRILGQRFEHIEFDIKYMEISIDISNFKASFNHTIPLQYIANLISLFTNEDGKQYIIDTNDASLCFTFHNGILNVNGISIVLTELGKTQLITFLKSNRIKHVY